MPQILSSRTANRLQLRHLQLTDPDNQRLLDGIGWQNDRSQVLRFLRNRAMEPTNNRAERARGYPFFR